MGNDTRTSNPGYHDRWTCPSCLKDVPDTSPGFCTCPCGQRLELTRESQPVCVATCVAPGACEDCGADDVSPNIEAFEICGRAVCDDCADAVFAEAETDAEEVA